MGRGVVVCMGGLVCARSSRLTRESLVMITIFVMTFLSLYVFEKQQFICLYASES